MRYVSILFVLGTLSGLAGADQHLLDPVDVSGTASPGASLDLRQPTEVGSWLGLPEMELPASTSAMGSAEMADRDITRAQDAAIRMPGITETPSPGNGGTALAARGFVGHNSVAQLVNGSRLVVGAGTITYPFSAWPLESVQVLRGPVSVLYGDGAIGAAVNYITKKPIWGWSERDAFFRVGSYGHAQGGIGLRGPLNDKVAYSLYLDGERGDGYRRFEDVERYNYSLAVSAKLTPRLTAGLSFDGGVNDDARYFGTPLRDGELLSSLRRTNFNVKDSVVNYDDRVWRATLDYEAAPGLRFHNETYYMTSDRHWRNVESYAFTDDGSAVRRSAYIEILHDQNQVGNRLTMNLDRDIGGHRNRFVLGLDGYRTEFEHTNNSPYGGTSLVDPFDVDHGVFDSTDPTTLGRDTTLRTTAVFLENALDLTERWTLVTGLRHERQRLVNQDRRDNVRESRDYEPTTGRVGLVWRPRRHLSVYGQYTTGTDPLSGALSLPGGGEDLDLTHARQVEVGMKGLLPAIHGQWTTAVYRIEKRDLLSRDANDPTLTQQVGRQTSTGLELAFAAELMPGWTLDANLAVLRAEYQRFDEAGPNGDTVSRDGKVPSGVPERTANLWSTWRFLPAWQAGLGMRYVGRRPSNAANDAWLPSYTVTDASLRYDYSDALRFTLAVNNVTDRDYAVSGAGDVRWLLGEPRTVQLTTRLTF